MIDIGNKVFDTVFNAVKANNAYPEADVTTGFDEVSAIFPCVVVEETNNQPYRRTNTDDCAENYTQLTYEISVYTDNINSAKSVGKNILNIVDTAMQSLKFRRVHKNKPLNINRTLFRQYARYEVIVGKPVVLNPNTQQEKTIYQMYRR